MIRKIVSGGQTGADQAALDAAVELGISHGGWVPKGRLIENGPLPEKYQLQELPTSSYPARPEQNVVDSDGTLILSHGELTGGSARTRQLAEKHGRPCLHVDLGCTEPFLAVKAVNYWINRHKIEVLNVAGSRASKDPEIYRAVKKVLKSVLNVNVADTRMEERPLIPGTVEEAIDDLMTVMDMRNLAELAKMKKKDLSDLHSTLGRYIRRRYGLWTGNKSLIQSCRDLTEEEEVHPYDASTLIIKELWKRLQRTFKMRLVK